MKRLIQVLLMLAILILTTTQINAQEISDNIVEMHGCDSIYMVQTPNDFHYIATEIIGNTPLPQTIDNYVASLESSGKCQIIDKNLIIWNICGVNGKKNVICEEWKLLTDLYVNEITYNHYYRRAASANSFDWGDIPHFNESVEIPQDELQTNIVESPSNFNITNYLIGIVLLIFGGVIIYFRFKPKNSRTKTNALNADDYIKNESITVNDLVE